LPCPHGQKLLGRATDRDRWRTFSAIAEEMATDRSLVC
jgi:hypothetical protein